MSKQNRGKNICRVVYDAEQKESIARKTIARDKREKRDKLRELNSTQVAEEIFKMLEQH